MARNSARPSHDLRAWLAVVAGPAAEASDDPGGEGQGSLWMRIALTLGLAFELGRDGFEDGLIVRIEGIAQELIGVAVARLHELLDGDGGNRAAATKLIMACGSPISASSISKPAVLSVRKNSSIVQRVR